MLWGGRQCDRQIGRCERVEQQAKHAEEHGIEGDEQRRHVTQVGLLDNHDIDRIEG